MRITLLFSLFISIAAAANAQQAITIVRTDMPNVNDIFRYSTVDNQLGLIDIDDVGPDRIWNYSTLGSYNQRLDSLVDPVFGTPLFYNVTFSNFFDMAHFSTIAKRSSLIQVPQNFITVENVYDFYRETNNFFANVGLGLTINGFPLTAVMEPRDMIYEFPLEFGDEDHSFAQYGVDVPQFGYFGQKITRNNTVDAWGELTTRYGTFNTLRVTTLLDITDTISIQGFGFDQPRPTQFEIKWMGKNIGTPLLTVKGQLLFGQEVISTVEYLDSIRGFTPSTPLPEPEDTTTVDSTSAGILDFLAPDDLSVQPNPFTDGFQVQMHLRASAELHAQLLDVTGKLVTNLGQRHFSVGDQLWSCHFAESVRPGLYHLVITDANGGRMVKKVMKQ